MQKDSYISVDKPSENTIVIQKSRFITTLLPIKDYDDALEKVKAISKKYSDATHNCYAFISNESATEQRFPMTESRRALPAYRCLKCLKSEKYI